MEYPKTKRDVLKAVGNIPYLDLHYSPGNYYWYFTYDNGEDIFETHSVMIMHLKDMRMDSWIEEANYFLKQIGVNK